MTAKYAQKCHWIRDIQLETRCFSSGLDKDWYMGKGERQGQTESNQESQV